jgi:GNAT superfamily N-acetyltransferase
MTATICKLPPEATRPLRQQLLRQHTPVDQLVYPGDLAPDTLHVGAFVGGQHIGIATVMCQPPTHSKGIPSDYPNPIDASAWRLRGMATVPAQRGQGIGRQMLQACIRHVAQQGGSVLWCDARIAARNFYQQNGFRVLGETYHVPDVGPHYFMQRQRQPTDAGLPGTLHTS